MDIYSIHFTSILKLVDDYFAYLQDSCSLDWKDVRMNALQLDFMRTIV